MRKFLFYSFLILILGSGVTAKAEVLDRVEVPIFNNKGNNQSGRPKAPELIPINCEYEDGVLYLEFYDDLDAVMVTVTNENTNEQWQTILQTPSSDSMIVSNETGSYRIEIITILNYNYFGYYIINY